MTDGSRVWKPADVDRLRTLAAAHENVAGIACQLGRSTEATKAQARKLGIGLLNVIGRPARLGRPA